MERAEKMPLKAFWEAVEQRLALCSADELRTILRAMAWKTPPAQRQTFLEKLEPVEEGTATVQQVIQQEDLLVDIEDLTLELRTAMDGADDWQERHSWGEYYDEEDSLGPYEEFVELLAELLGRADAAFDYGRLSLARDAYRELFELLTVEDDYGCGVRTSDLTGVDIGESLSRYLRAIYETEEPQSRPQALLEQMRWIRTHLMGPHLMLEDLVQISPQPLSDRDRFLGDWIALMRTQDGRDADAWLREAVRLSQGTRGLEALARAEGKAHPRAYLDWFIELEREDRHREVLLAAREALQALPAGLPIRAASADHLCAAAIRLDDTEAQHAARWEAFLGKPALSRLLDLWDAAPTDEERTTLMQEAVRHIQDYLAHASSHQGIAELWWSEDSLDRPAWVGKSVLAHAYLLSEDLDAAHRLATGENVLGWSSSANAQGLVLSFLLVLLSGNAPGDLPANLAGLWESGLLYSTGSGVWRDEEERGDPVRQRLGNIYAEQLARASLSDGRQKAFLSWCMKVARQRVDAIVGRQYRKSYYKAAMLTAACAEVLQLRGCEEEARSFVADIRAAFPRHSRFQRELRGSVQYTAGGL